MSKKEEKVQEDFFKTGEDPLGDKVIAERELKARVDVLAQQPYAKLTKEFGLFNPNSQREQKAAYQASEIALNREIDKVVNLGLPPDLDKLPTPSSEQIRDQFWANADKTIKEMDEESAEVMHSTETKEKEAKKMHEIFRGLREESVERIKELIRLDLSKLKQELTGIPNEFINGQPKNGPSATEVKIAIRIVEAREEKEALEAEALAKAEKLAA